MLLVDRRALAAQTVAAISSFEIPEGLKLDKAYEVYSREFRREDIEDFNFDSQVLPDEYLTNPQEKHTPRYSKNKKRLSDRLKNFLNVSRKKKSRKKK